LLKECGEETRSLTTIAKLVGELAEEQAPVKVKREVLGDWKLVFASDELAAAIVTTGVATGPFRLVEDVLLRVQPGQLRAIEIARRFGPFGNEKRALVGKWSATPRSMRWRWGWMEDLQGREAQPQSNEVYEPLVAHASPEMLILSFGATEGPRRFVDAPLLIFTSLPKKGGLDKELDSLGVDKEDELQ